MKKQILSLVLCLFLLLSFLPGCTSYPEETRMAKEYLGMTFGEIKALWGNDCALGGDLYEGMQKGVYYKDGRTPYTFLFESETTDLSSLSDDAVVILVRAETGKGKPCESLENSMTPDDTRALGLYGYETDFLKPTQRDTDNYNIEKENVSVRYYFYQMSLEEKKKFPTYGDYNVYRFTIPFVAYEVYATPEEYRQKQYYHHIPQAEIGFFLTYGVFPPESWDGESGAPMNVYWYYLDHGEWPDPDAVEEFIETGIWPEDSYVPYPYSDIERLYFKGEHQFWPPENWDYLPIDTASSTYHNIYGEWADPDAYEEFMETGHWPEGAYVPYPFSDSYLLSEYHNFGYWPEGTDLSQVEPTKPWWEE